ncbi:MAG: lipocalin-like domain-containing protein [Burkholderiaceae bacterium]
MSLVGVWRLIHTEAVDANGTRLTPPYGGDQAMGLISFSDSGRMACVLCDSSAAVPTDKPREYVSYCGAYVVDGDRLITKVDAASRPDWMGTEQIRTWSLAGDILELRPPLRAYAAAPEQRLLRWQRVGGL